MTNSKEILSKLFGVLMLLLGLWSCQPTPEEDFQLPDQVSFNFDIRPVLSNNCFVCHGPDSSSREAGLRLDMRETAIAELESGNRAIVPGSWQKSEIIRRISSSDHDFKMPPAEANKSLSSREIALIKKWIQQGAVWEPYWAFVPLQAPQIPQVNNAELTNNEVDNYIVKKLESNELEPSPLTSDASLIRRLSFVLTGLPPSEKLLKSYLSSPSEQNYQRVVDQLLLSPRFGEQWARHWMDLVRYADTRGHEFDYQIIGSWRYRDYLIRAFNQDIPYDQLILEHLAGDLLERPRLHPQKGFNESVMGTAFFCLSEGKHSPVDLRADQAERIDNIIDVTTKTFQALTVGCAKCHDHKFDPIPTTDYYSLYGILESTRFNLTPAGINASKLEALDSIKSDLIKIREFIADELSLEQEPEPHNVLSKKEEKEFNMLGDFRDGGLLSWISNGMAFSNALGQPIVKGDRLVGLEPGKASSKVYGKGLQGALRSPNFTITHDSIKVRAAGRHSEVRIIINNFQLIQDPIYGDLRIHTSSDEMQDYAIDVSMWKGHKAFIEVQVGNYGQKKGKDFHSYNIEPDAWVEVAYVYAYDQPLVLDPITWQGTDLKQAWERWQKGQAKASEIAALNENLKVKRPSVRGLKEKHDRVIARVRMIYDSVYLVGVTAGEPIKSSVFIRGNPQNPSEYKVPHRFFTAVSDTTQTFELSRSRLAFARKVADTLNPLTARVMVNRIWHHLFGRGLVETVDNFGLQGKPPTHPQLLDHLAVKFMRDGWSVKKMIRYLVMSQAFQRGSQPEGHAQSRDPDNLLWHHYPVRRLPAESIRDAILFTSGRLDTTMYGPPVPIYLTEFLKGRGRPSNSGPLDGAGRRSVYQRLMRNFLPPMMLAFDMPVPFSTFGKRNTSNVPAQSLTLMNDPFVIEQAKYWAEGLTSEPDTFNDRINKIYESAFSRAPTEQELEQAQDFFETQSQLYSSAEDQEIKIWQDYCHSVFNMKEFIFLI